MVSERMAMADKKKRIGVKYCGGCHIGYDRGKMSALLLEKIRKRGQDVIYETARAGSRYDSLLVLCNCSARCAACDAYTVTGQRIYIDHRLDETELDDTIELLLL